MSKGNNAKTGIAIVNLPQNVSSKFASYERDFCFKSPPGDLMIMQTGVFCGCPQANIWTVPQIRRDPPTSASIAIHYSSTNYIIIKDLSIK
jgi:hypothetical protein